MENLTLKTESRIFALINIIIILLAWYIQQSLYLNADASTLLNFTTRLMAGGHYLTDFFTPNPPLILFIYAPVVFISHFLAAAKPIVFLVYVFAITLISLGLSFLIAKQIVASIKNFPLYFFLTIITSVLLLLPLYQFGQREHLLVILTMPYFLGMYAHLNEVKLPHSYTVSLGILAAFGFAIKPYFMLTFVLIEIYFGFRKKSFFTWLRVDSIIILIFSAAYALILAIFFHAYLFDVLPYLWQMYYKGFPVEINAILSNHIFIFCFIPILVYFMQANHQQRNDLSTLLLIALFGFLLSLILQKQMFYYRIIPAFSIAIILYFYEAYQYLFSNNKFSFSEIAFLALFLLTLSLPIYAWSTSYLSGLAYKEQVLKPLINFMNHNNENKTIYVFSTVPRYVSPLIDYVNTNTKQRFDTLWMTDILVSETHRNGDKLILQHFKSNDYFFLRVIVEDFKKTKPDLIFVESSQHYDKFLFNYLYYFLQNPQFREEWTHYQYLTSIKFSGANHFLLVFKRKN